MRLEKSVAESRTESAEGASLRQQSRCIRANGAEGVRESVADLLWHSLAANGGK